MREFPHCRHCLGDGCTGDCLIGDAGRCIHGWNGRHQRQFSWRYVLARGWWRQKFWGSGGGRTDIT